LPDAEWGDVTEADRDAIGAAMLVDHKVDDGTVDYAAHIAGVAAANGLTAVVEEME